MQSEPVARTKRGLATTARPTKEQIERTVRDKFPEPQAGADAIPTHEQLPPQDWRSGGVDWGQGNAEERTMVQSAAFVLAANQYTYGWTR